MPKVVVRRGYRCQPGKRREVLAALQRIDAAAAAAGYPRGRYLLAETRAPGEPDLEVEFVFESYAEMEQLERRMREHVARYLREGGGTGQEFLLEPSATRHLLLVEDRPAATGARPAPARRAAPPSSGRPTPPSGDDELGEDDALEFEEPEEPDVPPPPDLPAGMSPQQYQAQQLASARAALASAERTVNLQPKPGGAPPRRPARPPDDDQP